MTALGKSVARLTCAQSAPGSAVHVASSRSRPATVCPALRRVVAGRIRRLVVEAQEDAVIARRRAVRQAQQRIRRQRVAGRERRAGALVGGGENGVGAGDRPAEIVLDDQRGFQVGVEGRAAA